MLSYIIKNVTINYVNNDIVTFLKINVTIDN